ncbi:DNA polymerase kappa [Magnaporthiopsis poae ATCC 64411]|uniref:DNA polymerase kappa n=1 Tax=Magnaporthiopsis poae (strain ATCC 64411 / 73-15) TaxID=644358 RepID=A0A0C4E590_MAGP6|nr:DNA polymerase kappa [Magnaporthiopsis poae ATCC 64411]
MAEADDTGNGVDASGGDEQHETLKYSLLGPSLLKAGQDSVDQSKVSEIIYNASKGSKFFAREAERDRELTEKIERITQKKAHLDTLDLSRDVRVADAWIMERELGRDLSQYIVHIDADAFYAACEQLDRPELADIPFAVGGGVLTTCNYVARKFGIRSGMAGFVAKKLCPELVLLKLNFDKYNAKAAEVREVLAEYDARFESASIDEAYLNITQYCADHNMGPAEVVQQMRAEVHQRTRITVSAGIAANAKLAKICSNMNKPNGQFVLPNERQAIMDFMRRLPCRKVNGIGRVLERELAAVGVVTCGDVYTERKYLTRLFGEKAFKFLVDCYLGLGRTTIRPAEEYERKSVGTESTFSDISDGQKLREKMRWTAGELEKDMKKAECRGRTLVLKIKLATFEVLTRQVILPRSVQLADDLYKFALPMLAKLEKEFPRLTCRLLGLRCTNLVSTKKPDTMSFFGLKPSRAESGDGGSLIGDDGWEQWPAEELETPGIDQERAELREPSPSRRHGKEIVPNPTPASKEPPTAEEWWDCPICGRPQSVNDKEFNEHIDACLSRQAIRDTVQQETRELSASEVPTPESKRAKSLPERKRTRGGSADPRQKRLCFG